ncbi:MAG: hypothetical protein H0X35_00865 [Pseudonocardiales bacterium]|nr:hypothetical protein [Pseudonocardiales bacterium]
MSLVPGDVAGDQGLRRGTAVLRAHGRTIFDEDAFDPMVQGYDLRRQIGNMACTWSALGGAEGDLCPTERVYALADLCGAPASSMLYDGTTHALDQTPAPVVGPFWPTEIADWLADRVADDPKPATSTHERVTFFGQAVPADRQLV